MDMNNRLCPDVPMQELMEQIRISEAEGRIGLLELLRSYPEDPRLHFLDGSLKAGRREYAEGKKAMRQALDLAPDYILARFQLGFLQLTCGEPIAAQETWGPLRGLPSDSYLRIFVEGLCHLIRDEFPAAIYKLEEGMRANHELPPLNHDMHLLVAEIRKRDDAGGEGEADEPMSAAQMLLTQASMKATRH